jgi:glycosyltransferase involved in cell wall biosynthesis
MNTARKVLFYNWEPAFAANRRGGGVSVYQDNCISRLLSRGWQVHSLSAGTAYDLTRSDPYITTPVDSKTLHVGFELVNSPVVAPAFYSHFIDQVTSGESSDRAVANVIISFIRMNGPYEVFHLNNLEGLPAAVLPILRHEFRDLRFVFFVHNYYLMCPQVNLWKNDSRNCDGKQSGQACCSCLGKDALTNFKGRASNVVSDSAMSDAIFGGRAQPQPTLVRRVIRKSLRLGGAKEFLSFLRRRIGSPLPFEAQNQIRRDDLPAYFREREQNLVKIMNESFDVILCDSDRVRVISVTAGISASKCKTSYPGTLFYRTPLPIHKPSNATSLKLAFLGVAIIKNKGLDFLIGALEQCPDALLSKLHVVLAAKWIYRKAGNRERLSALGNRLNRLTVKDGYSHGELSELLADVDLGVVPNLWEDCYPQVAVEFVCNGVPIIISNLGGAKEISSNPDFEFDVGTHMGLIKLIDKFANDKQQLLGFWNKDPEIFSMNAHIDELLEYYGAHNQEGAKLVSGLL